MALYEIWTEHSPGMYGPEYWNSFDATTGASEKLLLPMSWARGFAKELHERTGCRTEVRGTRAWNKVYASYGEMQESYGSIDDDMEGWR
jgi:hypothetical protein